MNWVTAIRGGGHNGAGLGICDGGLVIDLSRMKGVRVDPAARTARVAAGCVWGDVDHATHAFGMATPSGFISSTGVAGLTLGGGIGYLTRRYAFPDSYGRLAGIKKKYDPTNFFRVNQNIKPAT
jgi:FAD/FMN-containing dehydrogenase